ncbi:hypothetical protein [Lewinella sp. W8]|uniref:hypothetical protein n=1 Tax=Lewinella sp. W8 TaxID=2528208 RepID=UPI001067CD2F|nr:hypothetical protein [Lewinella sp. W8]MTB51108.1 hypothetical protein [Lewinella sp. W8]
MSKYFSHTSLWKEDADQFNPGRESRLIYRKPTSVRSFLQLGENDAYFILIGPKGSGKSLLLKEKAHSYTLEDRGYINLSGSEIAEKVTINAPVFEALSGFERERDWRDIWLFAICVLILANDKIPGNLPDSLQDKFHNAKAIGSIITEVIKDREQTGHYLKMIEQLCDEIRDKVQQPAFLCLDNVDGCLSSVIGDITKEDYESGRDALPNTAKVWTYSQIGAMKAVDAANSISSHLKVNVAIRKEVVPYISGQLLGNHLAKAVFLSLDKYELEQLFYNRIALTDPKELVTPHASEPFKRFTGLSTIPHRYVIHDDGSPMQETTFDYFYRHGFGRPRDLIVIGRAVSDLTQGPEFRAAPQEKRLSLLRQKVFEASQTNLRNYLKEVMPSLKRKVLENFIRKLKSNVIPMRQARQLDQDLLRYLFNLGCIGIVKNDPYNNTSDFIQHFEAPASNSYLDQRSLPDSPFYLVHPCLDLFFVENNRIHNGDWYNKTNIIGNMNSFRLPPENIGSLDSWKPSAVSGSRMKNPSQYHERPLEEYYEHFCKENEGILDRKANQLEENVADTFEKVFNLVMLHRLRAKGQLPVTDDQIEQAEKILEDCRLAQKHTAKLGRELNMYTVMRFQQKLQHRMLFLALYLIMELPLHQIKQFFHTEESFDLSLEPPRGNGPINFLQAAFFVEHLKGKLAEDPVERVGEKLKIFGNLSVIEKRCLLGIKEECKAYCQRFLESHHVEGLNCCDYLSIDWLK